jgi:hypothetical protein
MKKPSKLDKRTETLLQAFDAAAQSWGWQSDQGVGRAVDDARRSYEESKAKLIAHLRRKGLRPATTEKQ